MRNRTRGKKDIEGLLGGANERAEDDRRTGSQTPPVTVHTNNGTINIGSVVYGDSSDQQPEDEDDAAQRMAEIQDQLDANSQSLKEILNAVATPSSASQSKRRFKRVEPPFSNHSCNATSRPRHPDSIIAVTARDARQPLSLRLAYNAWCKLGRAQTSLDTLSTHVSRTTAKARHTTTRALSRIIYAPTRCANAIHKKAAQSAAQIQRSFFLPTANSTNSIPIHPIKIPPYLAFSNPMPPHMRAMTA